MKTKLLLIILLTSFCVSAQYSFEEFKINAKYRNIELELIEFESVAIKNQATEVEFALTNNLLQNVNNPVTAN